MRLRWPALGVLALTAGWAFHGQSIVPLQESERAARHTSATVDEQIREARQVIDEVLVLESQLGRAQSEFHSLLGERPKDSALVWFPAGMKKHFSRLGMAGAVTRLNTALDEAELPDFEHTYWAVELPLGSDSKKVCEVCLAIAEIEPLDPSIRVLDVAIRPDADDPTRRLMVLNVSVLSPKRKTAR